MKTVMVFGVFDQLHPGHEYFLCQAKTLGDQLIVAVARDNVIQELKGQTPVQNEETRIATIREQTCVDQAVFGDITLGSFESVYQVKPNIIALGYDQDELTSKLREWIKKTGTEIETVILKPHKAEIYKSAKLRERRP